MDSTGVLFPHCTYKHCASDVFCSASAAILSPLIAAPLSPPPPSKPALTKHECNDDRDIAEEGGTKELDDDKHGKD